MKKTKHKAFTIKPTICFPKIGGSKNPFYFRNFSINVREVLVSKERDNSYEITCKIDEMAEICIVLLGNI